MSERIDGVPAVLVRDLTVRLPNGRTLFDQASLRVAAGEFVLLVGASGSGKSTLLRLIANLTERHDDGLCVSGTISVQGQSEERASRQVGMVFQNLALFDELSPTDNVQFAIDHRASGDTALPGEAARWLDDLGVPQDAHLSKLSGGERQRVAVARTLAQNTPILLLDEPTTGLDPARTREVVDLIVDAHTRFQRTVIVVTHDGAPFLERHPRLVLVDMGQGKLRDVSAEEWRSELSRGQPPSPTSAPSKRIPRWVGWLEAPGETLARIAAACTAPFAGWSRRRWKLNYLWYYLRMVLFGTTAVYVVLAGLMLGFVSVTFAFRELPYGKITVPLLSEEFLAACGYSSFRVLVPLLISILAASKCGASVAADLGARRLTHQFEAMRSLGANPEHYLFGNIVVALCAAVPALTLLAFLASTYASMIAYLLSGDQFTTAMFRRNYLATVWPITHALPKGTWWTLSKTAGSGLLVAVLSYQIGSRPKPSSVEVGRDVGRTIFWASLAVLLLHSFYSFLEF